MTDIETDAERLAMLEGMPGLGSVRATIVGEPVSGMLDREFAEYALGLVNVAGVEAAILMLESQARRLSIVRGTAVAIEDEGAFVVRQVAHRPPDQGVGFTRLFLGRP